MLLKVRTMQIHNNNVIILYHNFSTDERKVLENAGVRGCRDSVKALKRNKSIISMVAKTNTKRKKKKCQMYI